MIITSDYHMHTPLCGHAVGSPEDYAMSAIRQGLLEIGISDHAPLLRYADPSVAMGLDKLPEYYTLLDRVVEKFSSELTIKRGLEADFIPGTESELRPLLEEYPYDYIIGSVHFIGEWGFDNPSQKSAWNDKDVTAVYKTYYRLLRESAQSGLFDIMGHVDLVKKFGHRPVEDVSDEIHVTAEVFAECGVVVEINTAGLRKPVNEIYPSLEVLKIYQSHGIPITFGSDAHDPQDVGRDFDKARDWALAAGYEDYVLFRQRKIERSVKL